MNTYQSRIISGGSSLLLDCLRIIAAMAVFYVHAHGQWFPATVHNGKGPGNISHAAVVVFFVLSGYVIAHTTTSNNRGKLQYAQARLSRLCSVVLPALLVTAIAELITGFVNPVLHAEYSRGFALPRYAITSVFFNEIWFFSSAPPINGPLWSLSYEFWYYAIFGLWFYKASSGWKSYVLPILALLVAGPKILFMMPIWLAGCYAYRLKRADISNTVAWMLVFFFFGVAGLSIAFVPPVPYGIDSKPFAYANQFVTDWVTGFFIAIGLWILPTAEKASTTQSGWVLGLRKFADLTFPLYVLHHPLLILFRAVIPHKMEIQQLWVAMLSVFAACMLIGLYLEAKRPYWSRFFKWLLAKVNGAYHSYSPALNTPTVS